LLANLPERRKLGLYSLSVSIPNNKFQDEVFSKNARTHARTHACISAAVLQLNAVHSFL